MYDFFSLEQNELYNFMYILLALLILKWCILSLSALSTELSQT